MHTHFFAIHFVQMIHLVLKKSSFSRTIFQSLPLKHLLKYDTEIPNSLKNLKVAMSKIVLELPENIFGYKCFLLTLDT